MIDVVVFCGPTIPPDLVHQRLTGAGLRVDVRPPVSQGDGVRAWLETRARTMAIIDGYFDRVPAVWHKELLWLLHQGVSVYGASSMGALRAAELHTFGMIGVGEIFEQFRDGVLVDDDEVAVLHASADDHYRSVSTAMVDLRADILTAASRGLIDPESADVLIATAKALPYRLRSATAVLAATETVTGPTGEPLDPEAMNQLRSFLRAQPSRKRIDAEQLLDRLIADAPTEAIGNTEARSDRVLPGWHLSHTVFLDALLHDVERIVAERTEAVTSDSSYITLAGETPPVLRKQALLRVLANDAAHRLGIEPTTEEVTAVMANFCQRYGLLTDESVRQWLTEAEWHWDGFVAAMTDLAVVEKIDRIHKFEIEPRLTGLVQFGRARAALDYSQSASGEADS